MKALRFLRFLLSQDYYLERTGDLEEVYTDLLEDAGPLRAKVWLWSQILRFCLETIRNYIIWRCIMIKNNFKIALRIIKQHKVYSFINITGLTLGIACCLFIGLYILFELSFDKFHENIERIYRINVAGQQVTVCPALAPAMKTNFPEVENSVQMYNIGETLVKLPNNLGIKTEIIYSNEQTFNVFTFPIINGNPETALEKPYSAVIDEEMARQYFGSENPLGKTLNISTRFGVDDFLITGVMKNIPENSHFSSHILVSLATFKQYGVNLNDWGSNYMHSYILLGNNTDYHAVENRITMLFKRYTGKEIKNYTLQPLKDIHLKSGDLSFQMKPGSDINYIYILSFTAFLILLIGCFNYMNLVTALSLKRHKEIGIRKVFGADKSLLVRQFLFESLFVTLVAVLLSVFIVFICIKPLSNLFGTEITFNLINIPSFLLLTLGIGIISVSLSGLYPAFYLSTFRPADIFRRANAEKPGKVFFRNSLVLIQFTISIFLIIATLVVTNQVQFIRNKKLGFDREHIIVISVFQNNEILDKQDIVKTEIQRIPGIKKMTFSSTIPMNLDWRNSVDYEGRIDYTNSIQICCAYVDYDYLDVFGLELVAGRNFSRDISTDAIFERAFIINEAAARQLGWEDPIGKKMRFSQKEWGTVIGVVKDFHNLPLSQRIEPVALMLTGTNKRLVSIKIHSENIPETIAAVEKTWNNFSEGWPFEYEFMDKTYDDMYRSEIRINDQFRFFSALAIFLSCFGLFGLVSFIIERRKKEIGIRKVLGASIAEILVYLSRGFSKQIILANIIAWPLAFYFMNKWLQNFAYRTNIDISVFIAAGAFSLIVAMITIISQTYKAAAANPVESIRNE